MKYLLNKIKLKIVDFILSKIYTLKKIKFYIESNSMSKWDYMYHNDNQKTYQF